MPGKRKPLSFPELDNLTPKGKGAILRSSEEVEAERAAMAAQEEMEVEEIELPENKISRKQESINSGKAAIKASDPSPIPREISLSPTQRATYKKSTYRLRPEALEALEDIKRHLRRRYDIKLNLEVIVEEAVFIAYRDLLEKEAASVLVEKISGNQDFKKSRKQ